MKQNETIDDQERLYSAPALEKGLDILECLATSEEPLTTRALAEQLGRSKNEIFRMVHVLLRRGYLTRMPGTEGLPVWQIVWPRHENTCKPRIDPSRPTRNGGLQRAHKPVG